MSELGIYDTVVIGAGANGLVAATVLARAGRRVLVVDGAHAIGRRTRVHEFAPGFSAAPLALDAGWVPPAVTQALGISLPDAVVPQYGVTVARTDDGFLAIPRDVMHGRDAVSRHSTHDADAWPSFVARMHAFAGVLARAYESPAPDIASTSPADLLAMLGVGRKARALGRADLAELLRVAPMSVQDLVDDTFDSPVIRAAVGAGGVRDIRQGPRSGGTAFVLMHYLTGAPAGSIRARAWWKDGPDAFIRAAQSAALASGVTIRTDAHVARILVRDDAVSGVVLDDAEEIFAQAVVSTADPAHTLLGLVDPVWLDPEFIRAVRNIKFRGATAIVQYAVDKLPDIPGLDGVVTMSAHLDVIERAYDAAKHGGMSAEPHVELTAPTLRWPALAPERKHVIVARASYVGDSAHARGAEFGDAVTSVIARAVPGFTSSILHREVLMPHDIERSFGLTEGAVTHGELTLDQIMFMRPVPGWSRYAMPIGGLYLGGAGAHPGPGVVGGAGLLAARAVLRRAGPG